MTLARHLKFLRKAHTEICHDRKGGQNVNHFTRQSKIHFDEEISITCQRPGNTQRTASESEEKGETPWKQKKIGNKKDWKQKRLTSY